MKILDKFNFCLWYKEIELRMKQHPATRFMWLLRVETIYKPLFKERGLRVVLDEHQKYVEYLQKRMYSDASN